MTLINIIMQGIVAIWLFVFGFPFLYWSIKQWPIIWRELKELRERRERDNDTH